MKLTGIPVSGTEYICADNAGPEQIGKILQKKTNYFPRFRSRILVL
jgi:BRCT domain type II-containing protein